MQNFLSISYRIIDHRWVKTRQRTPQFVVQAYLAGPKNVNLQETGHYWINFEEAITHYERTKK